MRLSRCDDGRIASPIGRERLGTGALVVICPNIPKPPAIRVRDTSWIDANFVNHVADIVTMIADTITNVAKMIPDTIPDITGMIANAVTNVAKMIPNSVPDITTMIANTVTNVA